MPTANSAASSQPNTPTSHPSPAALPRPSRLRRLTQAGFGLLASLAIILPAQTVMAPAVAASASPGSCSGWSSTTRPPDYIRVLRRRTGQVERVPFKQYVITVLGKEWPGYLPQAVIDAGAVAVKQYAWYHALGNGRVSPRGQCFDVTDGTGDQLYKPNKSRVRPDHYTAVNATWGVRLLKQGTLFMTGYRTGSKGACGRDATGWKLYARSATRCAYSGDSYLQILRIYYGPVAVVSGGGSAASVSPLSIDTGSSTATGSTSTDSTSTDAPTTPATDASATPAVVEITAEAGLTGGVQTGATQADENMPPSSPAFVPLGQRAFTAA